VARADRVYVDPSALLSAYLHDARSRRFCAWRSRLRGSVGVTRHGLLELQNAIGLAVFRGDVEATSADAAASDLFDDLRSGRTEILELPWRLALDGAADLGRLHTRRLGTRSLDVLHVACASVLGRKVFVTYDRRQASLARATGLRVLAP
jgi:predicted nucleic acid-binding protein